MDKKRGGLLSRLFILSYIFVILFNPPLISGINLRLLLLPFSIIFILFKRGITSRVLSILGKRIILLWVILLVYGFVSVGIDMIIGDGSNQAALTVSLLTICEFVFCSVFYVLFIIVFAYCYEISENELISIILIAGVIESILVLLSMVSPAIKQSFVSFMSDNLKTSNTKISNYLLNASSKRNFGLADSLYDVFGFTSSIIYVISLNRAFRRMKAGNWLITAMLLIMTIINARTGILLALIGTIVVIIGVLMERSDKRRFMKVSIFLLIGTFCCIAIASFIENNMPNTYSWISSGFDSTISYVNGEGSEDYFSQAKDFYFLPEETHNILFGTGVEPKDAIDRGSDVGFINEIWKFGFLGLMIEIALFAVLYKNATHGLTSGEQKFNSLFCVIAVAVYAIKLDPIKDCPGVYLVILMLAIYCVYNYRKTIEDKNEE